MSIPASCENKVNPTGLDNRALIIVSAILSPRWERLPAAIRPLTIIKAACFLLAMVSTWAFAGETVTVGWEPWEPYQYLNEKKELVGLDVEVLTALAKQAGIEIVFKEFPWKRILFYVENGELDMTSGASKAPEREVYAYYSEPYRMESAVMFVRKGTSANYALNELKDILSGSFQLGVEREYHYGENYAELMKNEAFAKHVQVVNRAELNYNKLLRNRIDGFLVDPFVGAAYLKRNKLADRIETHPMPIYSDAIHFLVSKKTSHPSLVERLNASIRKMKADGSLAAIIKKWL